VRIYGDVVEEPDVSPARVHASGVDRRRRL